MKRHKLIKVPPMKCNKKGNVLLAREVENCIEVELYEDKVLKFRYFIDKASGEHEVYQDGSWRICKLVTALGGQPQWDWVNNILGNSRHKEYNYKAAAAIIDEILETTSNRYRKGFDNLESLEREYDRDKAWDRESKRQHNLKNLHTIPDIDESKTDEYIINSVAKDLHYAFWLKDEGKYHCTCCGAKIDALVGQGRNGKVRHKDESVCTECGSKVIAIKRTDRVRIDTRLVVLQNIDTDKAMARHFDVNILFTPGKREIDYSEAVRVVMYREPEKGRRKKDALFYNRYIKFSGWGEDFDKTNPANRRTGEAYLYSEGIEEALKGTVYEEWTRIFTSFSAAGYRTNYNRMMACRHYGFADMVEYLYKGRFYRLLEETIEDISNWSFTYYGPLTIAKDINKVFQIEDMQKINRIRDIDGGNDAVRWMQYSDRSGEKISAESLEYLSEEGMSPEDFAYIHSRNIPMSINQIVNYIKRQHKESYPKHTPNGVVGQWNDYLMMADAQNKDLTDEMVYRPAKLKLRHDQLIENERKIKILKATLENDDSRRETAQKLREQYPLAEEILRDIKDKYEYEADGFKIIVPENLLDIITEGYALHHCVGTTGSDGKTNRYFARIEARETYICLLRRSIEPNIPYYTIELEPNGTIRQHRSYYDEEPGIEEIRDFLKKWQRHIKKKLTRKDYELQEISKNKRLANIEELRKANNTRVLQGLMEDFLEAAV